MHACVPAPFAVSRACIRACMRACVYACVRAHSPTSLSSSLTPTHPHVSRAPCRLSRSPASLLPLPPSPPSPPSPPLVGSPSPPSGHPLSPPLPWMLQPQQAAASASGAGATRASAR
eukprot:5667843-Pleurochrysis_carterae.AAC.2